MDQETKLAKSADKMFEALNKLSIGIMLAPIAAVSDGYAILAIYNMTAQHAPVALPVVSVQFVIGARILLDIAKMGETRFVTAEEREWNKAHPYKSAMDTIGRAAIPWLAAMFLHLILWVLA